MKDNTVIEIIDAIYELNSQYYEHNNKFDIVCPFVAICTGYQTIVKFFDIPIWNSDDDDREFNKTSNEYTPISSHLIKKAKELQKLGIFNFKPHLTKKV